MSGLLQDYVTEHAERLSDSVALVMGEQRVTYSELERESNRLARALVEMGCTHGDRVCLLTEKAPAAVIAMLATLKAGCTYVPIDVGSPPARVARIVRSADPAAALVLGPAIGLLEELRLIKALPPDLAIGALDGQTGSATERRFGPEEIAREPGDPLPRPGGSDDAAYIMFTSGSTGEPKGVVITHANVIAFIEWARSYFGTKAGDRISGHPPLHFDLSTFDVYGSFSAGAELHLVPPGPTLPHQLAQFISGSQLTQWFCVPSTMTYMAKLGALSDRGFPTLQRVIWCGEVLPTPVLIEWMRRTPQARFTNLYGPTEATIASSCYTVPAIPDDETAPIPIGAACNGEELVLLDEHRQAVPDGEIGELCIGGPGLSPGYWRDPEQTRAAFVADPRPGHAGERLYRTGDMARVGEDGQLYFLGRTDSQIKSRGYRIELGEIEAAVNALPGVAECAAVGIESDGFEGTSICCAFVPVHSADLEASTLRAELQAVLPGYMLPTRWTVLGELPKNVNGKIDRSRVRELFGAPAVPEQT